MGVSPDEECGWNWLIDVMAEPRLPFIPGLHRDSG